MRIAQLARDAERVEERINGRVTRRRLTLRRRPTAFRTAPLRSESVAVVHGFRIRTP